LGRDEQLERLTAVLDEAIAQTEAFLSRLAN
jgi:hypothetical protein